jgi:hypothetical protein
LAGLPPAFARRIERPAQRVVTRIISVTNRLSGET